VEPHLIQTRLNYCEARIYRDPNFQQIRQAGSSLRFTPRWVGRLKRLEGRRLDEQEKAAKLELSGTKAREEAEQEREETERVIDALGSGFEVTLC
jgi:hypothetical protein